MDSSRKIDQGVFGAMRYVTREIWDNKARIWRLAKFERKAQQGGTVLGNMWDFLNPALQIFVYWFVFSVGLKMSAMEGNVPYSIWMMSGILPWFFLNGAMMRSTNSIVSAANMLQNISFPLAAVPAKVVVMEWIDHLWTMAILIPVSILCGMKLTWNILFVAYYMVAAFLFLIAFSILTSAIDAVFRDFAQFLNPVLRLLMYVSSVIWSIDGLSPKLRMVMRLNPLTYIIQGYRDSMLYQGFPHEHWLHGIYFWCFTLALFAVGSMVHCRLRRRFIDVI